MTTSSAASRDETGIKPEWAAESFTDPGEDVRQSIARIKGQPVHRAQGRHPRLRLRRGHRQAQRSGLSTQLAVGTPPRPDRRRHSAQASAATTAAAVATDDCGF